MSDEDKLIDYLTNEINYKDYVKFVEFQVVKQGEIKKLKQQLKETQAKLDKAVEEQAVEIQKLKTKNNKLIESIVFAVYFMRESGYHCMDKIEPEFKMYREFKDILEEIKDA